MAMLFDKYRPKNLNEVVGQDISNGLERQIEQTGLPHTIISGKKGSDKVEFVYALSRTAFGEQFENNTEFASVEEFFSRTKNDLKDDPKFSRYFKEARQETKRLYQRYDIDKSAGSVSKENAFKQYIKTMSSNHPVGQANYRLLVLFEAERLSKNLQNALRRTIEKYGDNCRYAFIVTDLNNLIPALQSRCLHIPTKTTENTQKRIKKAIKQEKINITKEATKVLLYTTENDPIQSFLLLETLNSTTTQKITVEDIKKTMKQTTKTNIKQSLQKAVNGKTKQAIKKTDQLIYQENQKFDKLLQKWSKTINNLPLNDQTKAKIKIELAELDKNITQLPEDPNQKKKYGRTLYKQFLANINQQTKPNQT
ncbi:ATPase involved in DNA replication HolB small subunit [Methanonatronarchaeum thermophilum]|uniref:ATPase involved in DNA replication HolB small subunit n=1 Tax=Methanonatronarchaeum thermophilum TaxID=1927129 RepID=A0A1Y3GG44_9EURY|nr:hypothetical protein [Methanonatronarchaeum thermophilum]OUJ19283.1 ATPase involved in DNA replication HolB small subunit [Methanonatronarchaeum thermophilum]